MTKIKYPPLEDVWMDRESILGRVWVHLIELSSNPDTLLFFYSALELRFCIESIFFDLLAHVKKGKLSNRDLKVYKPKEFSALLEKLEPKYLSTTSNAIGVTLTRDDLAHLTQLYGQLGAHLHLPKEPFISRDQQEWKTKLEKLIITAFHYLNSLTGHKWPTKDANKGVQAIGDKSPQPDP